MNKMTNADHAITIANAAYRGKDWRIWSDARDSACQALNEGANEEHASMEAKASVMGNELRRHWHTVITESGQRMEVSFSK